MSEHNAPNLQFLFVCTVDFESATRAPDIEKNQQPFDPQKWIMVMWLLMKKIKHTNLQSLELYSIYCAEREDRGKMILFSQKKNLDTNNMC